MLKLLVFLRMPIIYFKEKFDNDLKPIVIAFKSARYLSPSKVNELEPIANDMDSFSAFPFLNTEAINGLKLVTRVSCSS